MCVCVLERGVCLWKRALAAKVLGLYPGTGKGQKQDCVAVGWRENQKARGVKSYSKRCPELNLPAVLRNEHCIPMECIIQCLPSFAAYTYLHFACG